MAKAAPNSPPPADDAPTPRGSGASRVYETLKRDILDMSLPPGEALDETGLSARFGLSRTPIREALLRLVAEGLAATLPNRTTIVSMVDMAGLPDHLDTLCLMHRITARLAAERRTPEDLARLQSHQDRFTTAVAAADAGEMIATNRDFHLAIAAAGGNRYYIDLLDRLLNDGIRLQRLYYRSFHDHLPPEYAAEHDALITAITARDADAADRLARDHARQIADQIRRFVTIGPAADLPLG